jgi:hypothetical protein
MRPPSVIGSRSPTRISSAAVGPFPSGPSSSSPVLRRSRYVRRRPHRRCARLPVMHPIVGGSRSDIEGRGFRSRPCYEERPWDTSMCRGFLASGIIEVAFHAASILRSEPCTGTKLDRTASWLLPGRGRWMRVPHPHALCDHGTLGGSLNTLRVVVTWKAVPWGH